MTTVSSCECVKARLLGFEATRGPARVLFPVACRSRDTWFLFANLIFVLSTSVTLTTFYGGTHESIFHQLPFTNSPARIRPLIGLHSRSITGSEPYAHRPGLGTDSRDSKTQLQTRLGLDSDGYRTRYHFRLCSKYRPCRTECPRNRHGRFAD